MSRPVISWQGLVQAAAALAGGLTLAAFFGGLWWGLEITTHFRLQYGVVLLLFSVVSLALRQWRAAAACAVGMLINAAVLAPWFSAPAAPARESLGEPLRLLTLNVNTENTGYDRVEEVILHQSPDVCFLMEVNQEWCARLRGLTNSYPHTLLEPREDNFGVALFSRVPWRDARMLTLGAAGLPSVEATLDWQGRTVRLLGTHPLPPWGAWRSQLRNDQLAAVAGYLRGSSQPWVLLGDLNATPWSPHFRRLVAQAGAADTLRGFGYQASWPTSVPVLGIPLDHALVSAGTVVMERRLTDNVGSDHRGVVVSLAWPRADGVPAPVRLLGPASASP